MGLGVTSRRWVSVSVSVGIISRISRWSMGASPRKKELKIKWGNLGCSARSSKNKSFNNQANMISEAAP